MADSDLTDDALVDTSLVNKDLTDKDAVNKDSTNKGAGSKETIRPGGRSARVQASVHRAVRDLLAERARADVTVPLIAARAGVTPSTIYRRWGDLPELLADVAVARMRPDSPPADTGSLRGDLHAWVEQYVEEMSSAPGRAMLRDTLASSVPDALPIQCASFTADTMELMLARARIRGENVPTANTLVDGVVAPLVYRLLFSTQPPGLDYARGLVDAALK
ncbi:TetR/AcrR family transcriptional regulator [Pigmentiphaga aceris]|uniref:TetR/AcrR family transcriptional regulator n=1 Tax=Pigmentiphaga aceris TaxID=1940612 RepID=UPI00319E1920